MLIIGHDLLQDLDFHFFQENEIIQEDRIYCVFYDEKSISYLKAKHAQFAILVQNKDEIFLSNALQAKFLIFQDPKLAQFASKVAEFYIFDSKILMLANTLQNLEKFYKLKVDGIILKTKIHNLPKLYP
ncbi:hypothetical protein N4T57_04360 [Campylobacter hepaticus]|uniref:Uncharacterized protein n=1 Tax=Campylobacter hepaticus TaxID=1813019 RepID=A0A6A7JTN3_9BACT|nr:hypothetical protein [Campylobacter hepaticus]AXP08541.1 hypothetical protein A2J15_002200 [Campylobacter hepaticus]MCZ0772380.1 hypothetical protein [Campylobacter hepaticus]MCZ0773848.1 hypothetical protein [Campylobacter hepaticus]MCZ0775099.1 hypothetical protein [Campylobacter hepaticus]MDX2324054.1 hypothetical protein [Campylobacter hepaticus]